MKTPNSSLYRKDPLPSRADTPETTRLLLQLAVRFLKQLVPRMIRHSHCQWLWWIILGTSWWPTENKNPPEPTKSSRQTPPQKENQIPATNPTAQKLYSLLAGSATSPGFFLWKSSSSSTPADTEGWFGWLCRIVFKYIFFLAALLGVVVLLCVAYRSCGEPVKNFVWLKVLRRRPVYSQQELEAMWDDDDGL